ncbi:MAG TPA: ATP-dependent helicase, partial [Chloroflexi bacterium]|nr:ATP-dependent helicase [Chloroflexota bacterium]
ADSRWLPFVASVFDRYERALRERGALDFNDLVTRAVAALEQDPSLAARLRQRWPYLLEDEAQDSTPLQERMLRLIAGPGGNLVRVGDGNQAIMTSFTSSDAQGFRDWLSDPAVQRFTLAGSSRSAQSILTLANHFSDRVRDAYPVVGARTALLHQPIAPVIGPAGLENPL